MEKNIYVNRAQLPGILLHPKTHVQVHGRGTGKSFDVGFIIDYCVRNMPRSIVALTGKTFGQLLTRTLPSTFKLLGMLGYAKDVNYVVGKRPPSHFLDSYEQINKFDNMISFANGTRIAMISQTEKGSGRGANTDFEIVDEACLIDKAQYDYEVGPTNRGNNEIFGPKGCKPCPLHHGALFTTSMPTTSEGRWILEYAKYYEEEAGIDLFTIWNKIVMLQVELLDITDKRQFRECWNEIVRLRKKIVPFVSKNNILFTTANAFDNIEMLGLSYLKENRKKLPNLIFLTEIMNYLYNKVEDCFYSINEQKQVYYCDSDQEELMRAAKETNFELKETNSSLYDRDCNPSLPIEIVPDWGSSISLFCVCQERNFDFAKGLTTKLRVQNFINEFFVKPDNNSNVLIKELCMKFTEYYRHHQCKELHYYRDKYGDHRNPNVVNSKSFNQEAIENFKKAGWKVIEEQYPGMEPPYSDKYLLWGKILREDDERLPLVRWNGYKCRYTLISMNNAMVIDRDGHLEKNKYSERKSSGVLPEEATHFSDAADKIVWAKYRQSLKKDAVEFVPIRIGGTTL